MPGSVAEICVLTFSVDRPRELARCIASVASQVGAPRLRHCVLSEYADSLRRDANLVGWADKVDWHKLDNEPFQGASSPRMASLRDAAIRRVSEPLVCFLDDDNEYAPDHIASLYGLIDRHGLDAAHSWRKVMNADGSPFPFSHYPWHDDAAVGSEIYRWCVERGVIVPGDPVMRDGVRGQDEEDGYATVDMNEWLFRTEILCGIGFDSQFSREDLHMRTGEDDKLYRRLLAKNARFKSSERPTLLYYLGGVSNLRLTSGPTADT